MVRVRGGAMAKPMVRKKCWGRKEEVNAKDLWKKWRLITLFKRRQLPLSFQNFYYHLYLGGSSQITTAI
jgi:hypothetical protein